MCKKQGFVDIMRELINSSENIKKAENIFEELTTKKIYIYGAGNAGTMTLKILQDNGILVEAFFDKRGGEDMQYYDKPVYNSNNIGLTEFNKDKSIIIIAFLCESSELKNIKERLLLCGWEKIYYFYNIYHSLIWHNFNYQEMENEHKESNAQEIGKIFEVASMMEDNESFEVLKNFFQAIINGNFEDFSLPSEQPQYFVNDIPFSKGYSRFIDCGAFDGDTARELKKHKGEIDAIALFEPDNNNFKKLCKTLKGIKIAKEQIVFPCGVWKSTEMLRFRSGVESSSSISSDGDTFIQCIAIDDVIGDFAPTFIKMDIEGSEYEALKGASQTVKKYVPDMAISVYHNIEHLWEIPLLIKGIDPSYKFYLRSHGLNGMETILYAISKNCIIDKSGSEDNDSRD